jgi:hypothetical protein|tara:strand:- start:197 stop:358 length:162 start_codon:yes stop_codon:yes gene_type:complete
MRDTGLIEEFNKILSESIKIVGTGILFFTFLLKGKIQADKMLVIFRFWVIKKI